MTRVSLHAEYLLIHTCILVSLWAAMSGKTTAIATHKCVIHVHHGPKNHTTVNCGRRHLRAIPAGLPITTTTADLSYNDFRIIHDKQFQFLSKLRSLSLQSCNISHLNKDAFYGLDLLEVLDLSVNHLHHPPEQIFKPLKSLRSIDLSYNTDIFGLSLTSSLFKVLHRLSRIDLSDVGLQYIAEGVFDTNIDLKEVYLSKNKFQNIPEAIFSNARNSVISLNHNHTIRLNISKSFSREKIRLDLSHNRISKLCRADLRPLSVFGQLSLIVEWNKITQICDNTFTDIRSIGELSISFNPLCKTTLRHSTHPARPVSCKAFQNFTYSLRKSRLYTLNARRIGLFFDNLDPVTFFHLKNAFLRKLDIGQNPLGRMQPSTFQFLANLTDLKLDNCGIKPFSLVAAIKPHRNTIKKIDFSYNNLDTNILVGTLNACPHLSELRFINKLDSSKARKQMRYYVEDHSSIRSLKFRPNKPNEIEYFVFKNLSSLEKLTVNELNGLAYSVFNLKKLKLQDLQQLQILDLSRNNAYLHCDIQSADYFKGMPNLRALQMHYNKLYLTDAPTLLVMFQSLHNVTYLDLHSNLLSELPVGMFDSMVRLRTLHLSRNKLRTIPKGLFRNLNQLHTLTLFSNSISSIQDGAFDGLVSLRVLKMGNNKLICDCNMRWFQQYYQRLDNKDSEEFCFGTASTHKIKITEFKPDWWQCDNNTTKVAVSAVGVLLFICFIAGIVYYPRWDIRYALVVRFGRQCCAKKPKDADVNLEKIFDAFVSYSLLDTAWVAAELIPNLENDEQFNFRLCIQERNFLPGNSIAESVERAMDGSYSVIFWITQNFLESDDCDFELNLAKTKLFEGNIRSVIFIFAERFNKTQLPQPMGIMIRHCQCLYWPDLRLRKRDFFWKRLKLVLLENRPIEN